MTSRLSRGWVEAGGMNSSMKDRAMKAWLSSNMV
jgi:hypothetical protein